jgi:cysteine desulfurase / selenocysteine lyase
MITNRRAFLGQLGLGLTLLETKAFAGTNNLEPYTESFWEDIRKQFPLTEKRIYFNNGTFGPSPTPVLNTIKDSLDNTNTSGEYGHTDTFREALAHFVNVSKEEISLAHNTTEGINIICWGLSLKPNDEVIISLHEHVGNALPWLNRAKLHGIKLRTFEPASTADETFHRIKSLISPQTKVIAIPHITCTTGQVLPVKEISEMARAKNIFTAIDGAHGAGTFNLDLKELGCDSYATSCHKWMLGPNGTGFLYIRKEHLDTLQAYNVGAYSDNGWDLYSNPPEIKAYNPTAHRFDYGSQSTPLYAGAAASAKFHLDIGKAKIEQRVRGLSNYLFEGLTDMADLLDVLTPKEPESRISMVTFKPKGMEYRDFSNKVSSQGFRIRVVPESNLDAIRISTHIYNSKSDIRKFLEVVKATLT